MLTSLEIENFKSIGARQRIDFAPLTLLFGANSAGKSTILQALLYLHELIEHGEANVDRTELGGSVLDLGGFARLVHQHDLERAIILRAEFPTPGGLERFGRDSSAFPFPDLNDDLVSGWIELRVRFRGAYGGPIIDRLVVGTSGVDAELVCIEPSGMLREGEPSYARVNLGHPLLEAYAEEPKDRWRTIAVPNGPRNAALRDEDGELGMSIHSTDGTGFGDLRSLFTFMLAHSRRCAIPDFSSPLRVIPFGDDPNEDSEAAQSATEVRDFLEMVVLGPIAQLSSFLRETLYIGPLRAIPTRGSLYERAGRPKSWADGLAAWDLLVSDRLSLVERTNKWLSRLHAGCRVVVQNLFDTNASAEAIAEGHSDRTARRLFLDAERSSFVLPSEVGAGISQLMPVIVAAVASPPSKLVAIEQPELHIHPALQVGLGDLFIEASASRTFILETHSEHLILRLLRRIRETNDNELPEDAPRFTADQLSVLYVENGRNGMKVRRLRVDAHGEFADRWPRGFFEERAEELF